MVSIWASAFAQQVHDRLEDTRAINAQREMANNVYNGQLVDLLDGQYKSNKKFYETEMTRKTSRRKPHMQDVNNALSALIELRVAQPSTSAQISAGGATSQQMSREDIEESIDMDQLYNVVVDMKEQNPSRRYTSQDWAISLGSVYKTNPDIFKKDPSKTEMAPASTSTDDDPVAIKNTKTLIDNQAQDTPTDNDSFLRTAATWLTPFYAALTNEPNNKMTDDNVRDLMRKRYGDNYDKMSKYREEYVPGRGTQHRVDPDIVRGLHDQLTKQWTGSEADRVAKRTQERFAVEQGNKSTLDFDLKPTYINSINKAATDKLSLLAKNLPGASLIEVKDSYGQDVGYKITFSTNTGTSDRVKQLFNRLNSSITNNTSSDLLEIIKKNKFNQADTNVYGKLLVARLDSLNALKVLTETNKEIVELGETAVTSIQKIKILERNMIKYNFEIPSDEEAGANQASAAGIILAQKLGEDGYSGLVHSPNNATAVTIVRNKDGELGYYGSGDNKWKILPEKYKNDVDTGWAALEGKLGVIKQVDVPRGEANGWFWHPKGEN